MAYVPLTWVSGEIVTATKMNQLSANDASFHDGTGITDGALSSAKIANGAVGASKLASTGTDALFDVLYSGTPSQSVTLSKSFNGYARIKVYYTDNDNFTGNNIDLFPDYEGQYFDASISHGNIDNNRLYVKTAAYYLHDNNKIDIYQNRHIEASIGSSSTGITSVVHSLVYRVEGWRI